MREPTRHPDTGPAGGTRLVAAFGGAGTATHLAHELERSGVPAADIRVDHVEDLAAAGRGEQRREARGVTVNVLGPGRQDQVAPGLIWATIGFIVGFALGAVAGLVVDIDDLPRMGSMAMIGVCGGLGGAAIGWVYGLGRGPELAGAGPDAPTRSVLSVPAEWAERRPDLVELLLSPPAASAWYVDPRGVTRQPLRSGTSDHPDAANGPHHLSPDHRSAEGPDPRNPTDTPLRDVVADLDRTGYGGQFRAVEGASVECLTCHARTPADRIRADEVTRLEGASDPDDMTVVVPVDCPRCGSSGTLVLHYGAEAGPEESDVLAAMPRRAHEPTTRSTVPGATPGIPQGPG